jgi:hypothetical protein
MFVNKVSIKEIAKRVWVLLAVTRAFAGGLGLFERFPLQYIGIFIFLLGFGVVIADFGSKDKGEPDKKVTIEIAASPAKAGGPRGRDKTPGRSSSRGEALAVVAKKVEKKVEEVDEEKEADKEVKEPPKSILKKVGVASEWLKDKEVKNE